VNLIGGLAGQKDAYVVARVTADGEDLGAGREVDRLVQVPRRVGQQPEYLAGWDADLVMLDVGVPRRGRGVLSFVDRVAVIAHGEGRQSLLAERRGDGGDGARIESAREQRADRHVGDQPAPDRCLE